MAVKTREKLALTPEATIGPFYPGVFVDQFAGDLTCVAPLVLHRPQGQPISLTMRFLDGVGKPVPSVIVEVWQANAHGRYRHPQDQSDAPLDPQFDGFARLRSDDQGRCTLTTVKPGSHRVGKFTRAPHLRLTLFASGIDRLTTQIFFGGEPLNAVDPVLSCVADAGVRERLVAQRVSTGGAVGIPAYEITIVLRGESETPFFEGPDEGNDG
jgi:protocatechuate 3,4-dioxygenase alpha subunit